MTCDECTGLAKQFDDGCAARDRGDLAEAARIFHEILDQVAPEDTKLIAVTSGQLGGLSLFWQANPDPDAAVVHFARAVAARPRWDLNSLGLFHALDAAGRLDDAVTEAARYLAQPRARDCEDYAAMLTNGYDEGLSDRGRAALLEARAHLARRALARQDARSDSSSSRSDS